MCVTKDSSCDNNTARRKKGARTSFFKILYTMASTGNHQQLFLNSEKWLGPDDFSQATEQPKEIHLETN